ncbi:hypothetical protein LTR53_014342 [Teratosphaeriaceae sp. CCFEE 6253]|nr:hypothetical protein LTR53_014342 [Teratosphaeriaceae sp. CCFEE 6253]
MARLIDLEEDGDSDPPDEASGGSMDDHGGEGSNPNIGLFSASLTCYPIVAQIALYLDLNSLHELSRTCRQFRAHLLQYRKQLIDRSLRCENEEANPAARLGNALHASHQVWKDYGTNGVKIGRITSGKLGACATDLVDACRRCGRVVCRNCTLKPPSQAALKGRHRRLCRTDMKASLERLTVVNRDVEG